VKQTQHHTIREMIQRIPVELPSARAHCNWHRTGVRCLDIKTRRQSHSIWNACTKSFVNDGAASLLAKPHPKRWNQSRRSTEQPLTNDPQPPARALEPTTLQVLFGKFHLLRNFQQRNSLGNAANRTITRSSLGKPPIASINKSPGAAPQHLTPGLEKSTPRTPPHRHPVHQHQGDKTDVETPHRIRAFCRSRSGSTNPWISSTPPRNCSPPILRHGVHTRTTSENTQSAPRSSL